MQIDLTSFLFQFINFGAVVVVLTLLVFKPVLRMLEERADKIKEGQQAADQAIEARQKLDDELAQKRQEANQTIKTELAEIKKKAEEKSAITLKEARAQAKEIKAKAQSEVEEYRHQLEKQMQAEFNESVLQVTERITGQLFDKKAASKLLDQELKRLSA